MKSFLKYILENQADKTEELSLLDKFINGKINSLDDERIFRANTPMIYAFITPKVPNAIKIGYTDQGVETRINQWRKKYDGIECIGYWTSKEFNNAGKYVFFKDQPVHKNVIKRGYDNIDLKKLADSDDDLRNIYVSKEFFKKVSRYASEDPKKKSDLCPEIITEIIEEMKNQIKDNSYSFTLYELMDDGTVDTSNKNKKAEVIFDKMNSFSPTKLQQDAIDKGVKAIKDGKKDLLMAAVMRFGKTATTYWIIKKAGVKYAVVTSAKADTRSAWQEDICHRDFKDFCFIDLWYGKTRVTEHKEDGKVHSTLYDADIETIVKQKEGKTIIVYVTLQDLTSGGEIKQKHQYLYSSEIDLLAIDETHYGSHSGIYGTATGLNGGKEDELDEKDYIDMSNKIKKLNAKIRLQVSGTPYAILASGEFGDEYAEKTIISDVSFNDMLEARDEWEDTHDDVKEWKSPYFGIPTMHRFGMKLSKTCQRVMAEKKVDWSLNELLKVSGNSFIHKEAITELMTGVFGDNKGDTVKAGFLENSGIHDKEIFKHTMMVLPLTETCHTMKKLLLDNKIIDESKRKIIVVVDGKKGQKDPEAATIEDLNKELKKLESEGKRSLIITVVRFLTGVSIPLIDSMLYMKDTKSPQEYDQAIFRMCTRYTPKVKGGEEGEMINKKRNVYLVDFNIDRMYRMVVQSAISQCVAKKKASIKDIEETIEKTMKGIPMYADTTGDPQGKSSIWDSKSKDILQGMHKLTEKDLLKYYSNYNENRDIETSISDNIDFFGSFVRNRNNMKLVDKFDLKSLNGGKKKDTNEEGTDELDLYGVEGNGGESKSAQSSGKVLTNKEKIDKELQGKLIGFLKNLLYCNICLEKPKADIEEFLDCGEDEENLLKDFNIEKSDMKSIYNAMTTSERQTVNRLMYQINLLMNDPSKQGIEGMVTGIKRLGKIAKNEVVTPESLVKKMIDKVDESEFRKAKSILIVNDKYGEFLVGICDKFGKDVANRCRIAASSQMTEHFIRRTIKKLGLNDYILLKIGDVDGDGKYDIKDFLKMKNTDIIKTNASISGTNEGRKFDICIMNPPYPNAELGGMYLDMQFVEKCNNLSNINIVVYPGTRFISNTKLGEKLQSEGHLKEIQFIDNNKIFDINTNSGIGGVYTYDNSHIYKTINVIKLDNSKIQCNLDIDSRKKIYKSLTINNNIQQIIDSLDSLYNKLMRDNLSMCNDGHGFIYEENRLQRGHKKFGVTKKDNIKLNKVKDYLKSKKYKYCLYKGSFNNEYDEIQQWKGEDPDELFKGQICWLTNSEKVKNNIVYWMDCPLFDLWRKYYLNGFKGTPGCSYGYLPALDFEMSEDKFKEYVDSLNKFTKEEIEVLKEFGVHNSDKLKEI